MFDILSNMNSLFNQEWFIQSLVEYILDNHEELYDEFVNYKKHIMIYNIFEINRKTWYFGLKHSKFLVIAHTNNSLKIPYRKDIYFATFSQMEQSLDKIIDANDIDKGHWWIVFSAYRIYVSRNGEETYIKVYFEDIDFHCPSGRI